MHETTNRVQKASTAADWNERGEKKQGKGSGALERYLAGELGQFPSRVKQSFLPFQPLQQITGTQRFLENPTAEPLSQFPFFATPGAGHDRLVLQCSLAAPKALFGNKIKPADMGHPIVGQQKITAGIIMGAGIAHTGIDRTNGRIGEGNNLVPMLLKQQGQKIATGIIILDYDYPWFHKNSSF